MFIIKDMKEICLLAKEFEIRRLYQHMQALLSKELNEKTSISLFEWSMRKNIELLSQYIRTFCPNFCGFCLNFCHYTLNIRVIYMGFIKLRFEGGAKSILCAK